MELSLANTLRTNSFCPLRVVKENSIKSISTIYPAIMENMEYSLVKVYAQTLELLWLAKRHVSGQRQWRAIMSYPCLKASVSKSVKSVSQSENYVPFCTVVTFLGVPLEPTLSRCHEGSQVVMALVLVIKRSQAWFPVWPLWRCCCCFLEQKTWPITHCSSLPSYVNVDLMLTRENSPPSCNINNGVNLEK